MVTESTSITPCSIKTIGAVVAVMNFKRFSKNEFTVQLCISGFTLNIQAGYIGTIYSLFLIIHTAVY